METNLATARIRGIGAYDGPPDLDKIVREWQQRLNAFLRRWQGWTAHGGPSGGQFTGRSALVGVIAFVIWIATGVYRVDAAERGVVTRFGAYRNRRARTALALPWPSSASSGSTSTKGALQAADPHVDGHENIVVVRLVVQYRRADPVKYLLRARPGGHLRTQRKRHSRGDRQNKRTSSCSRAARRSAGPDREAHPADSR